LTDSPGDTRKYFLTGAVVLVAVLAALIRYWDYVAHPWTRNGLVQATVVQINPRVSAPITNVAVNNNQYVHQGDLLVELDPRTFQAALDEAKAALEVARSKAAEAKDQADRAHDIRARNPGAMSKEELSTRENTQLAAEAQVHQAEAALETARLSLEFTRIKAPVDGYVTNLSLRNGSQAVTNQPLLALLDTNSYWIDAYFREDDMGNMQVGDHAVVTLMTYPDTPLRGKVSSIAWGIAQQDGSTSVNLLPAVAPTFEWIRLAQRVPVLIHLEEVPDHINLRVGTTASVLVRAGSAHEPGNESMTPAPSALE